MNQQGFVLWLTGLCSAGKSTVAVGLEQELRRRNCLVEVLDGDAIRKNLSKGLGFSRGDREINLRRIGFVANLLSRNGVVAIVAAISPYQTIRDEVRQSITAEFIEVYLNAPLEVCEARDPKGLYAMARAGELLAFTGIDDPYEPPENPEIVCDTDKETVDETLTKILTALEQRKLIPSPPKMEYCI